MTEAKPPRILHSEAAVQARVAQLAERISADFRGRTLDLVCLINGANVFGPDLARRLTVPVRMHFLGFSSYAKGNETGEVRVTLDVAEALNGRDVLVVEGIVISGRTPKFVCDYLALRRPASLALCVLGVKPAMLSAELPIAYSAFEFGSEVVVGYGVGSGPERMLPHLVETAA